MLTARQQLCLGQLRPWLYCVAVLRAAWDMGAEGPLLLLLGHELTHPCVSQLACCRAASTLTWMWSLKGEVWEEVWAWRLLVLLLGLLLLSQPPRLCPSLALLRQQLLLPA